MVRRAWPAAAIVLGLLLVAVGAFNLLPRKAPPEPDNTSALPAPIGIISPLPGATPEAAGRAWRVKVPELGIDLPVVAGDGHTAPLYKAVEEPNMKLPGEGGRSLIYAHARAGMFDPLFNAKVGQHVEIDRPGAPPLHYTIRTYTRKWPAKDLSILGPADHEELVLLTCTTYNPNDPRIVVVARPD
jgi:LPXTG-site transpeptidase (sortase) family protein